MGFNPGSEGVTDIAYSNPLMLRNQSKELTAFPRDFVPEDDFHRRIRARRKSARIYGWLIVFLLVIAAAGAGSFIVTKSYYVQTTYVYPYPYRITVEESAEEFGVDSSLVAAVIKTESKFSKDVHSHRGAVGLMQLMPDTAEWIAQQMGDVGYSEENLHDPARNIRYGTWYLAYLEKEFGGNTVLALAAYNAGRGNVDDWIERYGWDPGFSDIDAIPYDETRHYVRSVLNNEKKYVELYGY